MRKSTTIGTAALGLAVLGLGVAATASSAGTDAPARTVVVDEYRPSAAQFRQLEAEQDVGDGLDPATRGYIAMAQAAVEDHDPVASGIATRR